MTWIYLLLTWLLLQNNTCNSKLTSKSVWSVLFAIWRGCSVPKPSYFLHSFSCYTVYCVFLSLSKYLALNSIKTLKFSSLTIKSSTILFVHANCCFTPVFCNFIVSAIFCPEKRIQNNFPKNRVCLLGLAHVYYRECIKDNLCIDLMLSI